MEKVPIFVIRLMNTFIQIVINATLHHFHPKSSTIDKKKMKTDEILKQTAM